MSPSVAPDLLLLAWLSDGGGALAPVRRSSAGGGPGDTTGDGGISAVRDPTSPTMRAWGGARGGEAGREAGAEATPSAQPGAEATHPVPLWATSAAALEMLEAALRAKDARARSLAAELEESKRQLSAESTVRWAQLDELQRVRRAEREARSQTEECRSNIRALTEQNVEMRRSMQSTLLAKSALQMRLEEAERQLQHHRRELVSNSSLVRPSRQANGVPSTAAVQAPPSSSAPGAATQVPADDASGVRDEEEEEQQRQNAPPPAERGERKAARKPRRSRNVALGGGRDGI